MTIDIPSLIMLVMCLGLITVMVYFLVAVGGYGGRVLKTRSSVTRELEKLASGRLRCFYCRRVVTPENLGCIISTEAGVLVYCNDPRCLNNALQRLGDELIARRAVLEDGPNP